MVQPTRPGRPRRTVLLFDDILPSSTGIKSSDSLSLSAKGIEQGRDEQIARHVRHRAKSTEQPVHGEQDGKARERETDRRIDGGGVAAARGIRPEPALVLAEDPQHVSLFAASLFAESLFAVSLFAMSLFDASLACAA